MPIELFSLLMAHFICNAVAQDTLLSRQEAYFCTENFEHLKIALHPDLDYNSFKALPAQLRAKHSVEAYYHYKSWMKANPVIVTWFQENARDQIMRYRLTQ